MAANKPLNLETIVLDGKLRSADDPTTIGRDFRQLTNLRYTDTHPQGIKGMSKINTTALSTHPDIRSGIHLKKDTPAESHVIVQAFNSGGTQANIYSNATAIPDAGDFTATALLTQSDSPATANWSTAPHGNIVMCDEQGTYIWGGNELKVGSFINYDPDDSFWYNYTEHVQNNLTTGGSNTATLYRTTESVDANTKLLLHLDNNVTDSSATVHTFTNNNVTFSTSGAVFGTHRAVFTTNAYLAETNHADFDLSGGTFTIDLHGRVDDLDNDYSIYYQNTTNDSDSFNVIIDTNGAILVRIKAGSTKQFTGATDFETDGGIIAAGATYHIAIVESGDNWYIFKEGRLKAYTSDAARAANYTGDVQIGYDGTTYLEGKIDEFRLSDAARWTAPFEVPLAAYGAATNRTYMYVGSPRPLQGIKFYVGTANATAGTMSVDYWDGSSWAAVGSLLDGTDSGGVPLAATGTASFDSTKLTAEPSIIDDIVLYWYRVSITECDATTTLSYVTMDSPLQPIKDTWDGIERPVFSFRHWDDSADKYIDYTTNVYYPSYEEDFEETYATINSLAAADWLVAGFSDRQMGLSFSIVPNHENLNANAVISVSYWNGTAWTDVGELSDGTAKNGISFAQSGTISWNPVSGGSEFTTQVANETPLYYYKVSFSKAISGDVQVYYVSGTASPVRVGAYKYPLFAGDSVWLFNEVNGERNRVRRSVPGHADTFNGDLALDFTVGDSQELMAAKAIYMQIGTNLYEIIAICKRSETWMIVPTADSLQKFLVDGNKGCTASATMKTTSLGAKDALGTKRNVILWQGQNAIHLYDGRAVLDISDDIADYFDRRESYSINTSYAHISQAFFDELGHYHWCFASGTSTTPNKELVYDPERGKWYEIDRGSGNYLQCGIEVEDTTGNKYSYGCISEYMERLENGTDFDGTDITHTLYTGDIPLGKNISYQTRLDSIKLTTFATNTTSNTIALSYYRDTESATTATDTLSPAASGKRLAQPTSQAVAEPGAATYHALKFTMTTDDETIGFEPIYLSMFYKTIRPHTRG